MRTKKKCPATLKSKFNMRLSDEETHTQTHTDTDTHTHKHTHTHTHTVLKRHGAKGSLLFSSVDQGKFCIKALLTLY